MLVELVTPRLVLREFSPQELDALARLDAEETTRGFGWAGGVDRDGVAAALERWLGLYPRGLGQLAMVHREDGALIGHCGLEPADGGRILLSYALSKEYWCMGLAPEACREVLRYGFEELGLEEIWSHTGAHRRAWRGMMERLGMELREEFGGMVRYAVLRERFREAS
ncbi:GNAT family N-acetyltransferase [Rubrobacter naiadicus]|uniref:GNAT family N-acetyltransferase n=1 Tax=Rubrobacter naiadicus TaxID=1392641 RepID=UPI00236151DB|nr:GNAT family N-acetyltransferase [Rubrobacter naiadicus]